ncbi:MAG TPA: MBL fold metallo-hydrolase [Candidatus Kryptonia bacterium]|nr:MBL fold metallo-hydrolase [Candidatus Kryptonia bacterium]
MRLTYIGHAAAVFDVGGVRLITDPVFSEPLYCNTLWHYPPLALGIGDLPPVDFIYISHHHGDHFDPASLARFDKSAALIVPALDAGWAPPSTSAQRDRFHRAVRALGFKTVHVLGAWETLDLAPNFRVTMVPAATAEPDSSLLVEAAGTTAFVQNDNYLGDTVVAELARRFPVVDVGLMFSGSSIGYPAVADLSDEERWSEAQRRRYEYFFPKAVGYLAALRPRLFVPFANDLSWLAPEDLWINRLCRIHPAEFVNYLEAHPVAGVRPMLMQSGDEWSAASGLVRRGVLLDTNRLFEEMADYARTLAPAAAELRARERTVDTTGLRDLFLQRITAACRATRAAIQPIHRLTVYLRVTGRVPHEFTLAFGGGDCRVSEGAPSGEWDLRITVDDFLLVRALRGEIEFQEIRNTRWRISHPRGYSEAIRRFWLWLCVDVDSYLAGFEEPVAPASECAATDAFL